MTGTSPLSDLAPLNTFDPAAFLPTSEWAENVCAFVLSLAVCYNDFKDLMWARINLQKARPEGVPQKTAEWGQYSGLDQHLFRLQIAHLHELAKLIERNESVVSNEMFLKLINRLDQRARASWNELVNYGLQRETANHTYSTLSRIRNKVAFHYDAGELFRSYKKRFFDEQGKTSDEAYISRGSDLAKTRHFYADAAAQAYFSVIMTPDELKKVAQNIGELTKQLNFALWQILDRFIQAKGYGFRS